MAGSWENLKLDGLQLDSPQWRNGTNIGNGGGQPVKPISLGLRNPITLLGAQTGFGNLHFVCQSLPNLPPPPSCEVQQPIFGTLANLNRFMGQLRFGSHEGRGVSVVAEPFFAEFPASAIDSHS